MAKETIDAIRKAEQEAAAQEKEAKAKGEALVEQAKAQAKEDDRKQVANAKAAAEQALHAVEEELLTQSKQLDETACEEQNQLREKAAKRQAAAVQAVMDCLRA